MIDAMIIRIYMMMIFNLDCLKFNFFFFRSVFFLCLSGSVWARAHTLTHSRCVSFVCIWMCTCVRWAFHFRFENDISRYEYIWIWVLVLKKEAPKTPTAVTYFMECWIDHTIARWAHQRKHIVIEYNNNNN